MLVTELSATSDGACYRAMDWLLQIREALEKRVFDRACEVLGLEIDLLFFDTTSTYFVTEQADARSPATSTGTGPRTAARARARRWGSGLEASPRTAATACPRSLSAWPSPAMASPLRGLVLARNKRSGVPNPLNSAIFYLFDYKRDNQVTTTLDSRVEAHLNAGFRPRVRRSGQEHPASSAR